MRFPRFAALLLLVFVPAALADTIKDEKKSGTLYEEESYSACDIIELEAVKDGDAAVATATLRGKQEGDFPNGYLNVNTAGNGTSAPEFIVDPSGNVSSVTGLDEQGFPEGQQQVGEAKVTLAAGGKEIVFEVAFDVLGSPTKVGVQVQTCGEGAVDIAPGANYVDDRTFDGTIDYKYLDVAAAERIIEGKIVVGCIKDERSCKRLPFKGAKVTAKGKKGTFKATTDTDGKFSIGVKKGAYSVSADAGILNVAPEDRRVDVTRKKSGTANFEACGFKQAKASAAAVKDGRYVGGVEKVCAENRNISAADSYFVSWESGTLFVRWISIGICKSATPGKHPWAEDPEVAFEGVIRPGAPGHNLSVGADKVEFAAPIGSAQSGYTLSGTITAQGGSAIGTKKVGSCTYGGNRAALAKQ